MRVQNCQPLHTQSPRTDSDSSTSLYKFTKLRCSPDVFSVVLLIIIIWCLLCAKILCVMGSQDLYDALLSSCWPMYSHLWKKNNFNSIISLPTVVIIGNKSFTFLCLKFNLLYTCTCMSLSKHTTRVYKTTHFTFHKLLHSSSMNQYILPGCLHVITYWLQFKNIV